MYFVQPVSFTALIMCQLCQLPAFLYDNRVSHLTCSFTSLTLAWPGMEMLMVL